MNGRRKDTILSHNLLDIFQIVDDRRFRRTFGVRVDTHVFKVQIDQVIVHDGREAQDKKLTFRTKLAGFGYETKF